MSLPDPGRSGSAAAPGPAAEPAPPPPARPRRWWHEPFMWLVVGGPLLVVLAGIVTAWLAARDADPVLMPEAGRRVERAREPALKARNAASTDAAQQAAAARAGQDPASRTDAGR